MVVHIMDQVLHKAGTFLNPLHLLLALVVVEDFNMMALKIMVAQVVVQVLQYLQSRQVRQLMLL